MIEIAIGEYKATIAIETAIAIFAIGVMPCLYIRVNLRHLFFNLHRNIQVAISNGFTVNNKKTHTPYFSTLRFSRISPKPLWLQKYIYSFLYQFLKSSQLEFFISDDMISWYWQKRWFSNKKLAIKKNPPFKKKNLKFSIYVNEYNLHTNKISTKKLSHNLFKLD